MLAQIWAFSCGYCQGVQLGNEFLWVQQQVFLFSSIPFSSASLLLSFFLFPCLLSSFPLLLLLFSSLLVCFSLPSSLCVPYLLLTHCFQRRGSIPMVFSFESHRSRFDAEKICQLLKLRIFLLRIFDSSVFKHQHSKGKERESGERNFQTEWYEKKQKVTCSFLSEVYCYSFAVDFSLAAVPLPSTAVKVKNESNLLFLFLSLLLSLTSGFFLFFFFLLHLASCFVLLTFLF